jgi:alkanesulfonate monooxygenase SsuD/methylene tetrahydromethanopterin reductase-like flavin-dependent oxidoreductase (luciferase family)
MQIGVSLTTSFPRTLDARDVGRHLIERAAAIRAAGLDSLFVGDHHATGGHYFQNVPALARLLAEVGDITVGALFLAPLHHPVLMAEQVGTLAALAQGPFVLVMAAGDDEAQFAPFGVPLKQRPSRLEEHLSIIRRLLDGESVSHKGRYHTLKNVRISPLPPERVPIWIAASARPALERAARMADGWLAAPSATGEVLSTATTIYRQAAQREHRPSLLTIRRDVYVGESDAEAEEAVAPVLARGYRGFGREALLVGSPATVIEGLREIHEMGFEHVLIRHIVPQQDLVLASYRRIGRDVLPEVRRWPSSECAEEKTPP